MFRLLSQIFSKTNSLPPELIAEAKKHPNDWVYVIDGGYDDYGSIPPGAIVGAWKVDENGEIIQNSYKPNPNYVQNNSKTENEIENSESRTADFHEDDFCQQELLPVENWFFCIRQLGEIKNFSNEHFDGFGWSDVIIREEAPKSLSDLGMKLQKVEEICNRFCPPYEKVTTGYSSYVEECKRVKAFGPEKGYTIFIGYDENNIVDNIWFDLWIGNAEQITALSNILSEINRENEIMFVDWAWEELFKINDVNSMSVYLNKRYSDE